MSSPMSRALSRSLGSELPNEINRDDKHSSEIRERENIEESEIDKVDDFINLEQPYFKIKSKKYKIQKNSDIYTNLQQLEKREESSEQKELFVK